MLTKGKKEGATTKKAAADNEYKIILENKATPVDVATTSYITFKKNEKNIDYLDFRNHKC